MDNSHWKSSQIQTDWPKSPCLVSLDHFFNKFIDNWKKLRATFKRIALKLSNIWRKQLWFNDFFCWCQRNEGHACFSWKIVYESQKTSNQKLMMNQNTIKRLKNDFFYHIFHSVSTKVKFVPAVRMFIS